MTSAVPGMRRMALLLSVAAAAACALAVALGVGLSGGIGIAVAAAGAFVGVLVALTATGGWIAAARQARLEAGQPDLFLQSNAGRSEQAVSTPRPVASPGAVRRWLAAHLFGHRHVVGDVVRVRSEAAIRATLDAQGCLDGLPFMDEMAAYCGHEGTVYRVVDKIYDYGRSRQMRRLDDCVLLLGLRCNGAAHAGCQAACYLIWKAQWLEPVRAAAAPGVKEPRAPIPPDVTDRAVLSCQYTQLTTASTPMRPLHWQRLIGPWVVGNVTARAFWVAVLTRLFNAVQQRRGGVPYPWQPDPGNDKSQVPTPLRAGDWVRVRSAAEIARTLDKNSKNKGLWFDRDMLKHCGSVRRVRGRVEKIIDIHTSAMIPMKTPCIVLEDVHYSGEFQGFGEQHDYLYWREAWLEPTAPATGAPAATP
jgi:hypothetical protein